MRELTVLCDNEPFNPHTRMCLSGEASIGLFPSLFTLKLRNLSREDFIHLRNTKELTVKNGNSCLACGKVSDVYMETVPEGTLATVAFSFGMELWEKWVSLDVPAGSTMGRTVSAILTAAGVCPASFSVPGPDPVFSRGQAFLGRAAQCAETALTRAGARCYLTRSGLCVVPSEPLQPTLHLKREDYTDRPVFADGGHKLVIPTKVVGYQLGEEISAELPEGITLPGLILRRSVEADTGNGPWKTELLVELHDPMILNRNERSDG